MTASKIDNEPLYPFDEGVDAAHADPLIRSLLPAFDAALKQYSYFHLFFITVILLQIASLAVAVTMLIKNSLFGYGSAALFLSFFSYFLLRQYFIAKKEENCNDLIEEFCEKIKCQIGYREGVYSHHMILASAYERFAVHLVGWEFIRYHVPLLHYLLNYIMGRISSYFHWHDLVGMKEKLVLASINEQLKLVRIDPTNLEYHASLASSYVNLTHLYHYCSGRIDAPWTVSEKFTAAMDVKFRESAQKAIEEFTILKEYAPNDPWVHEQLALSYRDLNMPDKELQEYEIVASLRPDDQEILFKIGQLYFQLGHNAKGLQNYEKLRQLNYLRAEQLIRLYGA